MKIKINWHLPYPLLMTLASAVGLIASFWQATERVHMLKDPQSPLSCNLSPIVDCGGVLGNKAAALFGPPNAFIGMVAFSLLLAFGVQRLSGGQWTRVAQRIVVTLSVVMLLFSVWFFIVSVYIIGKICIFCIFIWMSSVPLAVYTVKDYFSDVSTLPRYARETLAYLAKNSAIVTFYVYLAMLGTFLIHFRDYYF